ncbi:MAG: hypothetical protein R3F33_15605 [Planctomycetota bacterium]
MGQELLVSYSEQPPAGFSPPDRVEDSGIFSASFVLQDYRRRGSHELYLAGEDPKGNPVLEHWEVLPADSGYFQVCITSHRNTRRGTPVAPEAKVEALRGSPFLPQDKRPKAMRVRREQLYAGSTPGRLTSVIVDAEDRYVLYRVQGDSRLRQFWFATEETVDIADANSIGLLSGQIIGRSAWNSTDCGRCILFDFLPAQLNDSEVTLLLLCDIDNDGNFDLIEELSNDAFALHPARADRTADSRR